MKRIIIFLLFILGSLSLTLFFFYLIALFLFVFGEGDYPGMVAFIPKYIFLLSPLALLGWTKDVQSVLKYLG